MEKIKHKVLLVDDEEGNLSLLHRTLRQDFEIYKTTSPIEGLGILQDIPIDVIISDHKMPEMDGVEFLKRSCEHAPGAIRILITAYSDSKILIDAINYAKIYRYIKKPWEPSELLITIKTAMEYSKLKQENDQLIMDLKDLFAGTINAIIEALDAKDSFTLGRSRRVTFLALKMVRHFDVAMEEYGKLELAGLLHDIGMIGVPEDVLYKPGKLTDEEFAQIKQHVDHGVKILRDIKQLNSVVEIIKYHHERFDGSGYPYGKKGEDIPLNARIIAVADAYDSMISNRSYRQGLSHEEAIQRIEEQSGKQFDPKVVEVFLKIIPEILEEIKKFDEGS